MNTSDSEPVFVWFKKLQNLMMRPLLAVRDDPVLLLPIGAMAAMLVLLAFVVLDEMSADQRRRLKLDLVQSGELALYCKEDELSEKRVRITEPVIGYVDRHWITKTQTYRKIHCLVAPNK